MHCQDWTTNILKEDYHRWSQVIQEIYTNSFKHIYLNFDSHRQKNLNTNMILVVPCYKFYKPIAVRTFPEGTVCSLNLSVGE